MLMPLCCVKSLFRIAPLSVDVDAICPSYAMVSKNVYGAMSGACDIQVKERN